MTWTFVEVLERSTSLWRFGDDTPRSPIVLVPNRGGHAHRRSLAATCLVMGKDEDPFNPSKLAPPAVLAAPTVESVLASTNEAVAVLGSSFEWHLLHAIVTSDNQPLYREIDREDSRFPTTVAGAAPDLLLRSM